MSKVIITAAVTGTLTSRLHTPYVPLSQQEIVEEAVRCEGAGAAVIHIHLRDENGLPMLGEVPFKELTQEIRRRTKLLVCISTSSWGTEGSIEERIGGVRAAPELASFHVDSMNRGQGLFVNSLDYQKALLEVMHQHGCKPEFEIFDLGQLEKAKAIHEKNQLPGPFYVQFVLGTASGLSAQPRHLLHMVESLPPHACWSIAAVGKGQLPLNMMGLILGGHVRTGLEDNVYLRPGQLATSNAQLVERIALMARELGRESASPEEAREQLHGPLCLI